MQYVWEQRLWPQSGMRTVDGRRVQVIDPGTLNHDSGPDFFNAKIVLDGEVWAGNIEIHVKASDWHRHGHDSDENYDSVILHVVDKDDAVIRRKNGEIIPQMRMPCASDLNRHYGELTGRADTDLPCESTIKQMPKLYLTDWLETLAYERLYDKADRIEELRSKFAGDWEQACYVTVARCLGFGTNSEPFERLALSLPLIIIGKHSDSLTAIEALLFGQSGLLESASDDPYASHLKKEYNFLAKKFGLRRPENLGWKMSRMRPANFPHRRIAVLAALLHGGFRMLNRIVSIKTVDEACQLFMPSFEGYWESRYRFGAPSQRILTSMSRNSAMIMTINAVIPLMAAYAAANGDRTLEDRAVELMHKIGAENNTVISMFHRAGIESPDAFTTQALIQLRRNYCEKKKCLFCRIGHRKLSSHAIRHD